MTHELDDLRYLLPPDDSFWKWADSGDVIQWQRVGTIAFREQLREVLLPYAGRRLPPLELVLLILAACRSSWSVASAWLVKEGSPFRSSARPVTHEWWTMALKSLNQVYELPPKYRNNPAAVATMIEIALDRAPDSGHRADGVLELLSRPRWLDDLELPDPFIKPAGVRINELNSLMHGLSKLTPERIEARLKTGLDRLPEPAEIEIEVDEPEDVRTVRQLLDELVDDEELAGLVRLVKSLTAVLTLPRDLEEPEDLPQGGVSDIANRGPLDRLLLSELAHDDDTLTMRIALNEALYIRRESPPSNPLRERVLLIDAGIRTWGLPRLCATAVGLCLALEDEQGRPARVFRSHAAGLMQVDFTTREGLIDHLAALDHQAHPGAVLPEWLAQAGRPDIHRVFITSEDVMADREFRRVLSASGILPCFIATVSREGQVRLVERTLMGERPLREMWLDLDDVVGTKPRTEASLVDTSFDPTPPAILKLQTFPFRLPTSNRNPLSYVVFPRSELGIYHLLQVLGDRRLLLWDQLGRGARQLTDRLPSGKLLWSGQLSLEGTSLAIGHQHPPKATLVTVLQDDPDLFEQTLEVSDDPLLAMCDHLGMLFAVNRCGIHAIDPSTGKRVHWKSIPSTLKFQSQRFFSDRSGWYAVSFNGRAIHLEELIHFVRHGIDPHAILGVVGKTDRPVAVLTSGEVLDITQRTRQRVVDSWVGCHIAAVSHDGNRFVVRKNWGATDSSCVVVSLQPNLTTNKCIEPLHRNVMPSCWNFPSQYSLYANPARLSYNREVLMIVTKKGRRLQFVLREQGSSRKFAMQASTAQFAQPLHDSPVFQNCAAPSGVGYQLRQVCWPDGSRVVLDCRGMLHLQSSDRSIPELTLVLHEDGVAVWCADGRVSGPAYFVDDEARYTHTDDPQFAMEILQRFLRQLPT